jgi:hypothetical protein
MVRSRLVRFVISACVALLAAGLIGSRCANSDGTSVSLKDGTSLTVRQVSFGKVHRFSGGSLWRRLAAAAPTNITAALGIRVRTDITPTDTLVVWLQWPESTNKPPVPQWIRVVDSNGLASAMAASKAMLQHANNAVAVAFHLANFPRRDRTLLLQLYGADTAKPNGIKHLADFRLRNPAWVKALPKDEASYGAIARVHGEAFSLLELNTGLEATGWLAEMNVSNHWTEFVFLIGTNQPAHLTTNLLPGGDWAIKGIQLRDAFGNFVQERSPKGRMIAMGDQILTRADDGIVVVPGAIWPDQVWHIRAEFERTLTQSLDAAHRWATAVRVPAEGQKVLLAQTGVIEDCTIELRSIAVVSS